MKFNKIKDLKDSQKKDETNKQTNASKVKKKFYLQKKDTKIKTKVCMPKIKEDISANWMQMQELIKIKNDQVNKDEQKKQPKKSGKKSDKSNAIESNKQSNDKNKNLSLKEKFKLKRKLKRENAKLNKKSSRKFDEKLNKQPNKSTNDKVKNDLWFEVDQIYLDRAINPGQPAKQIEADDLIKKNSTAGLTKVIGIDCEMVGVGARKQSALARISMVNQFGHTIYDKFVLPDEKITDYRTFVSGIRPNDLKDGLHIDIARKEVEDIICNKTLVGHAIKNDLSALGIKHPRLRIRDTSIYFKKMFNGKIPSLKRLSETLLNVKVQSGEHSSVEDAKATMRLYTLYKKDWESSISKPASLNKNKK